MKDQTSSPSITEVSQEELSYLVQEAERAEERALAAIAERKARQVLALRLEPGLIQRARRPRRMRRYNLPRLTGLRPHGAAA